MDQDMYSPPKAEIREPVVAEAVPEEILKKIRTGWIAGLVSTGFTLLFVLMALAGIKMLGFSAWELVDVALMAGLTFGVYKKSRVCAVLLFIYFIIAKIILIAGSGQSSGIWMALAFIYCYGMGVAGTFQYHKWLREQV